MKIKFNEEAFDDVAHEVEEVALSDEVERKYAGYTFYTIADRALVDVIDGLKPVQRRILYTMYKSGFTPSKPHTKSARIVGATMGEYHPHGDTGIYDAMVRLAQSTTFSLPVVDGQGNFGGPGLDAAASRYTEARLSSFGMLMTEELSDKVVDMKPNYDDSTEEPVVLPAQVPLLLINGTTGIAVAMASNMAPHNPVESIKACIYQLEHQDAWEVIKDAETPEERQDKTRALVQKLMKSLPGPDFPTGGQLLGTEGIEEAYVTGVGKVVIRAQYTVEPDKRGKNRIIFHDFPYGVSAVGILKQLAEAEEKFLTSTRTLRENGGKGKVEGYQIDGIESVDDFADGENATRLEVLVSAKTNPEVVVAELFKRTRLEGTFNFNQNCLVNGTPKVVILPELIQHFLNFRLAVVTRRSESELDKRTARNHLLSGLLKVLVDIDEAIKIIRASDSQEKASEGLKKQFKIDDLQAKHILDTPLRRLTKMDSLDIEKEQKEIAERIAYLKELLSNTDMQRGIVKDELLNAVERIKKDDGKYGFTYKRKSVLANVSLEEYASEMEEALSMSREVSDDPCTLYLDAEGKVSRSSRKPYIGTLDTTILGTYVAITNRGRGFRASVLDGVSTPLDSGEKIVALVNQEQDAVIGTKYGVVFAFKPNYPTRSDEFPIISLGDGDEVLGGSVLPSDETAEIVFLANDASLLRFGADKVAAKATLNGKGMAGMKLADDAVALAFKVIPASKADTTQVLTYTGVSAKLTPLSEYPSKGRATGGVRAHRFLKGESALALAGLGTGLQALGSDDEVQSDLSAYEGKRDGSGIKVAGEFTQLAGV